MYWLPKYADRFGRRSFFILVCLANTILFTLLMICNSMYLMILILFCFGLVSSGRSLVGWMYLMELIPMRSADFIGTVLQGINYSIYTVATLYFWLLCKDWFYFTAIGYVLQVVSMLLIFSLPESPLVLIELRRFRSAE